MITPLHHQFKPSTVYYWVSSDSEELYQKNWRENKQLLTKLGYTPDVKIEYRIDGYGFRNHQTRITGSILTLGCSFTFGIGLHVEDIWPTLLGERLQKPVYNAGLNGTSADNAFRILNELLKEHRPIAVFCMMPSDDRWEFHWDDKYTNFGPWGMTGGAEFEADEIRIISELHMNEERNQLNQLKNLLGMQKLCDKRNIPFMHLDRHTGRVEALEVAGVDDWARDLGHQGRKWHQIISERMENLFEESLDK